MRDGVEEYEYFRLLATLQGDRDKVDALVDSIVNQPFGSQSLGNLDVWNHNPSEWDRVRLEVGAMIAEAVKH